MDYADAEIIMGRAYEVLDWHYKPDFGLSPDGFSAVREALMAVGVPNLEANEQIKRWEREHFDPVKLKVMRYWIHRQLLSDRGDELIRTTRILARPRKNREIS